MFSLSCLLWEMVQGEVPWTHHTLRDIPALAARGYTLKLDRDTMPRLLFRVMREGLVWNVDMRDLELGEVRDMLLMERDIQERRMEAVARGVEVEPERQNSPKERLDTGQSHKEGLDTGNSRKEELNTGFIEHKPSALHLFTKTAIQSDIHKYVRRDKDPVVLEDDNYSGVDLPSVVEGPLEDDHESSICSVDNLATNHKSNKTDKNRPPNKHFQAQSENPSSFLIKYKRLSNYGNGKKNPENVPSRTLSGAKHLVRSAFPSKVHKQVARDFQQSNPPAKIFGMQAPQREELQENTSHDRFESAKSFFEESCATELRGLNVSSGELFRTALSSPAHTAQAKTSPQLKENQGTFIRHWNRRSTDDVETKDSNPKPCDNAVDDKPQIGSVKDNVRFYQSLEEEVNGNRTFYQSAQDSPKSSEGGRGVNKSVQTEPASVSQGARFLAESTPIYNDRRVIQTTPLKSPLYSSPLFQTRRSTANLNEQRRPVIEESFSMTSPIVDFTNPDERQKMFTAALSRAQMMSPASLTSKEAVSSPYQTCLEESDVINNNLDQSYQNKQAVVTFNSSVEEITTSIVSLVTDNSPTTQCQSSTKENFDTIENTEDNYFDDDLNSDHPQEPVNIQLLTQGRRNI